MSGIAVEGKSIPDIIVRHLDELVALANCVSELHKKCQISKQHNSQRTAASIRNSLSPSASPTSPSILHQLRNQLNGVQMQHLYYQRVVCKEHYERVLGELMEKIGKICGDRAHLFYSQRKVQIQVIRDVVGTLECIQRKVVKYLGDLGILYPREIRLFVKEVAGLVQRIKVERQSIPCKFQICFNFPKPVYQSPPKQPAHNIKIQRPETSKFSYAITSTTRPSSSTGKSLRQHPKPTRTPKSFLNTQPASIHQNQPSKQTPLSKQKQKPAKVRPIKMARCRTAKSVKRNLIGEKFDRNENEGDCNNIRSSVEFKQQTPVESTFKRTFNSNKNSQPDSPNTTHIFNSTPKHRFFQQPHQNTRKPRPARIENNNIWRELNPFKMADAAQLQRYMQKGQKMSDTIYLRDGVRVTKRNFQSHQNFVVIQERRSVKRVKNTVNKKKSQINRRNKAMKLNETPETPEQASFTQHKPTILLIKPPSQTLKHPKTPQYILHKSSQKPPKQKNRPSTDNPTAKDLKKSNQIQSISNSQQISLQNIIKDHKLKIDIDEINRIRASFVDARWQNRIIGGEGQENSVFFVQQGFLSQRENTRFQAHLKKLKEDYGNQYHREPFNIENETEELNNEKLIQLERFYTFQSQDQWIAHRYRERLDEFVQVGLEKTRQFVI